MGDVSVYRTVGVGRVDTNKIVELGKNIINVIPLEWLPMHDGEMTSTPTDMTFKTNDVDGVEKQGVIKTDMVIKADWMPNSTNRLSAPDVRRGERVEILQVGNSPEYYWRSMGMDDNLRKLETIIFGISATTNEGDTTLSPTNMYWIEFSSHTKKLAFSSAKANGEAFLYEMYFDMEASEVMITDDVGNFVNIQSLVNLIHLQNADGAFVKLDKRDIKAYAPNNIEAKADKDVNITAGNNMNLKAGVQAMIDGGGSVMTLNAGSTTLKTPVFVGTT